MNILHIVTHLGGGVGTVLLNWAEIDINNIHRFICFGYNFEQVINKCKEKNIELHNQVSYDFAYNYIKNNNIDIIIVHYWNHPLLVDFLVRTKLPECRIIIYSHISGTSLPYIIPEKFENYADRLIHTSLSSKKAIAENVIMSTGGVEKYKTMIAKKHNGFNILYAGTLDFSKLRSDFVEICDKIIKQIPESHFIICGDGFSKNNIIKKTKELNINKNFTFTGLVHKITPYFEIADVFLYPLCSTHYGTGEQVLGEAMTCGIVPIVFDNLCEKQVVKNLYNGFVVKNVEDCVDAVNIVYKNNAKRKEMSIKARESALNIYSIDKFIDKWNVVLKDILKLEKKCREWKIDSDLQKYEFGTITFLESLGEHSQSFKDLIPMISIENKIKNIFRSSQQWESESKGSIKQYLKHFPDNVFLKKLEKILRCK